MARGVTEAQIHTTADTLLAAGDRPTVERVRLALGRGSPNSIGPMLDRWWTGLAARLARRLELPAVPDSAANAFALAWEAALEAGRAHAEAALAPERAALAEERAAVEARLANAAEAASKSDAERQSALAAAAAAEATLAVSEQRSVDLANRITALEAQVLDLSVRRDALEARLDAVQVRADAERVAAAAQLDAMQAHLKQAEDRAYGEVDRLRQEVKAHKAAALSQAREHAIALRTSEQGRRAAEIATHAAERSTAAALARVQLLEQQRMAQADPSARKTRAPRRRGPRHRPTVDASQRDEPSGTATGSPNGGRKKRSEKTLKPPAP